MNMSEEEVKKILIPVIKKLANDPIDYVKLEMSINIVSLIEVCSQPVIND
jgi:hypothetical protein